MLKNNYLLFINKFLLFLLHNFKYLNIMEIKIGSQQMLKILYILSWIIFIGLCIEAGGFIFNTIYTLFIDPVKTPQFWREIDLSALYAFNTTHFITQGALISIVAVLQAIIFYLIVKIIHDKKLDLAQPFNNATQRFVSNAAYLSIGIGLFSNWGASFAKWCTKQGVKMPDIDAMRLDGADVWLFMGIILLVIAQIFKRGIEIQTENELTV